MTFEELVCCLAGNTQDTRFWKSMKHEKKLQNMRHRLKRIADNPYASSDLYPIFPAINGPKMGRWFNSNSAARYKYVKVDLTLDDYPKTITVWGYESQFEYAPKQSEHRTFRPHSIPPVFVDIDYSGIEKKLYEHQLRWLDKFRDPYLGTNEMKTGIFTYVISEIDSDGQPVKILDQGMIVSANYQTANAAALVAYCRKNTSADVDKIRCQSLQFTGS